MCPIRLANANLVGDAEIIKSFKHLGIGSSAPANPEQFASNKLATVNVVVVFKTRDD
jgi:hypothetical protein